MANEQLTWRERGQLWLRLGIRLLLIVLTIAALRKLGPPLLSLLAPFLAAALAAAMLNRPLRWFQRKVGWSRHSLTLLLILLALVVICGVLGLLVYTAGSELISLLQSWEMLQDKLVTFLDTTKALFAKLLALFPESVTLSLEGWSTALLEYLDQAVPAALSSLSGHAAHIAMGIPSKVVAILIFVMSTYFLASDYPYLRARCVQNMDSGFLHFADQVRITALGAFGGYLKAQLLLSTGVFFILLVGFTIIHQSYSVLLALVLAVVDFIPLLGAGTVLIPWSVIALFNRDLTATVQLLVIWGVVTLYRRIMEPKVVGDQTGLSPILSLASIYVGMKLGGVLGMILGPVCTLVVLNLFSMGIFHGMRLDLSAAAQDISAILAQHPGNRP